MATYKITFSYVVNTYGFSETWYDNTSTTFNQLTTKALTYLQLRLLFSGTNTYGTFIRISAQTNPRQVVVVNPAVVPGFNNQGQFLALNIQDSNDQSRATDDPDIALLTRFNAGNTGRSKLLYLRGIPDAIITSGGLYATYPNFNNPFNNWIGNGANPVPGSIVANVWGWQGQAAQAPPPAPVLSSPILSVTPLPNPTSNLVIGVSNLILFAPYETGTRLTVTLKRMTGANNLNGTWPVTVYSNSAVQMTRQIPIIGFVPGPATLTIKSPTFLAATGAQIQRVVERKAGKPSFQSPGRRPIRRYQSR